MSERAIQGCSRSRIHKLAVNKQKSMKVRSASYQLDKERDKTWIKGGEEEAGAPNQNNVVDVGEAAPAQR